MPRTEFDEVKLSEGPSIQVSGTVRPLGGETLSDEPMRVAWVVQEAGEQNFSGGVSSVNAVDDGVRKWSGTGLVPPSWKGAPPETVEATGTLLAGGADRFGRIDHSVEHRDAVVWTQLKKLTPG
jgi:hypothetical protein